MKNNLDEMQEQTLLKIEHNMAWLAFYGLLAVILGQLAILGAQGVQHLLGELLVFFCLCGYLLADCIRKGIWDRKLKPGDKKGNLKLCLRFCALFSAVLAVVAYRASGNWISALVIAVITIAVSMLVCWGILALVTQIFNRQVEKLENSSCE